MPLLVGQALAAIATAGLILAGWGFGDLAGFARDPVRVVALGLSAVGSFYLRRGLRFRIEVEREVRSQVVIPFLTLAGFAVMLFGFPWAEAHPEAFPYFQAPSAIVRWTGVLFLLGGTSLQVWALVVLGRWFTPRIAVQAGHHVVDRGPYRILRHPFYTGILLTMIGFPASFGSWFGGVGAVASLPILLFRIRVEERLLEANLGEAYRALRARTYRLIPLVY